MVAFMARFFIAVWLLLILIIGITILIGLFQSIPTTIRDITNCICIFGALSIIISLIQFVFLGVFNPLNLFE